MGRQVARDDAFRALHERHAVIFQDLLDLIGIILQRKLEHVFEERVGLAHADRHLELERHGIVVEIDRLNGDRLVLHGLHPAGEGAIHASDIDIAVHGALHDVPGLMLRNDVAVVRLSLKHDVIEDTPLVEGLADARGLVHPDLEIFQLGIVKAAELEALVAGISEHIGGLVDRFGREHQLIVRRHVEHHVAHVHSESLPRQATLDGRSPVEGHLGAHGLAEQLSQLLLVALLIDAGERHVARIGADFELLQPLRLIGGLGGGPNGDLFAGKQVFEVLAQIPADFCLSGGWKRGASQGGDGKGYRENSQEHGGHWGFSRVSGAARPRASRRLPDNKGNGARCRKGIGRR